MAGKMVHLKDGAEVLDFAFCKGSFAERNFNNRPKVIFLDLKMPRMDGLEVLEPIKKDEQTKSIPIVIRASSRQDDVDMHKCYDLGASSYIVKPLEFDNFSNAVAKLGFYGLY
jgi:CheY-like chemotaxis protein